MKSTLESILDGALLPDPDLELDACISQIQPVILSLKQQGIQPSAIIAALARLTVATTRAETLAQ